MAYKIENGKVYEIKEVDTTEIEKEVKQVVAFIKQHEEAQKPYLTAIVTKQNEKQAIVEKYDREIAQYQTVVDDHTKKIDEAKSQLADKKEIISQIYPAYKDFLGF